MFRTIVYPSSGACDCIDELPHPSSYSQFVVCWSFGCGWYLVVFVLQAEACKTNTRWIRAYDELQIAVTEVGQVKQTVTTLTWEIRSLGKENIPTDTSPTSKVT